MHSPYRQLAREALTRARTHLDRAEGDHYRYAALELRMAIEGLTYDRATAYKEEIPPSEMDKWQPRKLMEVLIEIEPHADKGSTLSFARENEAGEPAEPMQGLGTENVLGLATIRKHYDALGSFVHIPSMRQADVTPDFAKIGARCKEIAAEVERALSSRIYNINFGSFSTMTCEECGSIVRKRIPIDSQSVEAQCFQCQATYLLVPEPGNKVKWIPQMESVQCPTTGCMQLTHIWKSEVKAGSHWTCGGCGHRVGIGLTVFPFEKTQLAEKGKANDGPA